MRTSPISFNLFLKETGLKGYDEEKGKGILREVTVREIKNRLIITAVITENRLPFSDRLIEILKNNLKNEFSLYVNENAKNTNVIYGDKFSLLYGAGEYSSEFDGIKYKIGVRSFSQVNDEICEKLYAAAKEEVAADEDTVVIDAYSGAGLMTALFSSDAFRAVGIEIIPEAVNCANDLAIQNGLDKKMSNLLGKCEDIMPDIIPKERAVGKKLTVVLDPPRKGCDGRVLEAINKSEPEKSKAER